MKRELDAILEQLNLNREAEKLVDIAVILIYKNGRSSIDHSPGIEDRAAPVIGYLTALCADLVKFVKR